MLTQICNPTLNQALCWPFQSLQRGIDQWAKVAHLAPRSLRQKILLSDYLTCWGALRVIPLLGKCDRVDQCMHSWFQSKPARSLTICLKNMIVSKSPVLWGVSDDFENYSNCDSIHVIFDLYFQGSIQEVDYSTQ